MQGETQAVQLPKPGVPSELAAGQAKPLTLNPKPGVPSELAAGQAIWSADGTGIILTTFPVEPRRLGVRFYNTRKSRIAVVPAPTMFAPATALAAPPQQGQVSSASAGTSNLSAVLRWLTPEDEWSARNPKLSPDGSKIIYVVSANSTAHFSASKLMCAGWPSGAIMHMPLLNSVPVIDIIPVVASPDEFPGLFLASEQLPRRVRAHLCRRECLHMHCPRVHTVLCTPSPSSGDYPVALCPVALFGFLHAHQACLHKS